MKENKSLLGKLKNIFQPKEEETKQNWNSKDWIEIKAPGGSAPISSPLRNERPVTPIVQKSSSKFTPTHRGPAVPQNTTNARPLTKDRIQKERTTYSGRDPAKPVERMSADDLKKKWPGAFDQRR